MGRITLMNSKSPVTTNTTTSLNTEVRKASVGNHLRSGLLVGGLKYRCNEAGKNASARGISKANTEIKMLGQPRATTTKG